MTESDVMYRTSADCLDVGFVCCCTMCTSFVMLQIYNFADYFIIDLVFCVSIHIHVNVHEVCGVTYYIMCTRLVPH